MPYNKLFINLACSVCTEQYRTEVFFVQTEPVGRGLYKKTEVQYFSVHTEQARLIKSLLYGIYRHLYKQEMHDLKGILVAWYTFGRRKQKNTNVFLLFH
jgi:hypothetical protein